MLARKSLSPADRALALSESGDVAWERGDLASAARRFSQVVALHRDRASDRTAAVKLAAVGDAMAGPVLRRFFARSGEVPELLALKDLAAAQPTNAAARYLLGRTILQRGAPAAALPYLDEAARLGLSDAELSREDQRLRIQAAYLAGDCAHADELGRALLASAESSDRAFAQDWIERSAFGQEIYGGALHADR